MPQNELIHIARQAELPGIQPNPHLSNRGVPTVPPVVVSSQIDNICAMFPYPIAEPGTYFCRLPIPQDLLVVNVVGYGIANWRRSATLTPAGTFYWNPGERQRGSYVVLGGEDLAIIRALLGMTDDELIKRLLWNATNVTRLDFATDITTGAVRDTRQHWEAGKVITRVKNAWQRDNFAGKPGDAIYYGSEKSERFVRVYDKAAELGKFGEFVLTRIELQSRKKRADMLADDMRKYGVKAAGKSTTKSFLDFPELDWYQDALHAQDAPVSVTPRKETSFMKWLHEQVGPAIEKHMHNEDEADEILDWCSQVLGSITSTGQE